MSDQKLNTDCKQKRYERCQNSEAPGVQHDFLCKLLVSLRHIDTHDAI